MYLEVGMRIMDKRQVSSKHKPSKFTSLRDFPKVCGPKAATMNTTLKGITQQNYKSHDEAYLHKDLPESSRREHTKFAQNAPEIESELAGYGYWKKRKCAIRSSPSKEIHIKKEKLESFSNEACVVQCNSNVVSPEYFDLLCKKKVEPIEEDAVLYECNVGSRGELDQQGKKMVESDNDLMSKKVKKALGLFRSVCESLGEEKRKADGIKCTRIDFRAAKILKDSLKHISIDKPMIGSIPGVEVNDKFLYRAELRIVGIRRPAQSGIDYLNQDGTLLATSIINSGGYANDIHNSDILVYVGQGGRVTPKNKVPEDQVLEKGNLALKNSIKAGNPIRVLHKVKMMNSLRRKDSEMYTYDGLYRADAYWHEFGHFGKRVYKFKLVRLQGQSKFVAR